MAAPYALPPVAVRRGSVDGATRDARFKFGRPRLSSPGDLPSAPSSSSSPTKPGSDFASRLSQRSVPQARLRVVEQIRPQYRLDPVFLTAASDAVGSGGGGLGAVQGAPAAAATTAAPPLAVVQSPHARAASPSRSLPTAQPLPPPQPLSPAAVAAAPRFGRR